MAVRIDASGDKLYRTANLPARDNFTIAGWGYRNSAQNGSYRYFAGLEDATSNSNGWLLIGWAADNAFQIASDASTVNSASSPAASTWFYWFIQRSGTSMTIGYKTTGGSWVTTNASGTLSWTPAVLHLGNDSYDEWTDISLERVRVWDAALTTTELDSEMASAAPVRTTNLRANWPLTVHTDLTDTTANGYNLSSAGTLTTYTPGPLGSAVGLTATAITTGAPSVGAPTIGQVHALTASGITTGAPVLDTPSMAGGASLTATNIVTGALSVGAPVIGQVHALNVAGIATGAPVLGTPSMEPLLGACIGGVLTVDGTNGRYFRNGSGIVFLAGFHTWASIQDSWPSLPITPLDFDEYLSALVSYGCNFTKAWILESAKDWGDSVQYFAPLPWARTGPGTAHDGRPKFDLTQFDDDYFTRLRERCIRLGNAGIYVCVQLFQGWHISKKGFGTGDPWANHPMNAANNINGVDGDTNGDVVGLETRTTTLAATYNIQKAYVEKVIDTLNDLDNVFWEISNEEENSSLTWQRALVDYIQTYEAGKPKQHLVGMTVCWPSGDNQDLYDTTTIDWLSPGGDFVPETASAVKISAFDTDHVGGLTSEYKWILRALAQGHGGTWYMDEWAGETYGNDTRSNATYQKIRSILGYALDYAARIDLANATPQPSLASTGYCLAKTSGAAQILAYQDGSGSFTVNLTGISGTFSLEWLRTANGTTQAGSNVSGGATRTLTPPWAGEDVLAFLELIGYDLTAANIVTGTPTLGTPAIGQTHVLTSADIATGAPAVAAPTLAQIHPFTATDIATGAPTVAAPTLAQAHALAAAGITTVTPTLDAPTIAQVHALAAVAITTGAPTLGAPSMSGESALTASDITAGTPALDAPTLAQVHVLTAVTVVTGAPVLDAPAIGQTHALSASGIVTGTPTLGTPSMVGESALVAADITTGAAVLGTPAIGQVHGLTVGGVTAGAAVVGAPAISQVHILTAVLIVAGAPTLGTPSLDRAVMPVPAERTFVVAWEDRTYIVSAESRTYTVTGE